MADDYTYGDYYETNPVYESGFTPFSGTTYTQDPESDAQYILESGGNPEAYGLVQLESGGWDIADPDLYYIRQSGLNPADYGYTTSGGTSWVDPMEDFYNPSTGSYEITEANMNKVTPELLNSMGFTIQDLKTGGFGAKDLAWIGYSQDQLKDWYTPDELTGAFEATQAGVNQSYLAGKTDANGRLTSPVTIGGFSFPAGTAVSDITSKLPQSQGGTASEQASLLDRALNFGGKLTPAAIKKLANGENLTAEDIAGLNMMGSGAANAVSAYLKNQRQDEAAKTAIGYQQPFFEAGKNALTKYQEIVAKNQTPTAPTFEKFSYDPNNYFNSPVYQALLKSGLDATNAAAGAKGLTGSGNVLTELQKTGMGVGAQYMGQDYNMALGQHQANVGQQQQTFQNQNVAYANALAPYATLMGTGQEAGTRAGLFAVGQGDKAAGNIQQGVGGVSQFLSGTLGGGSADTNQNSLFKIS